MAGSFDLRGIDLNLLVTLNALLEEQSVSGAARRLCCGQPAVSKKLATLRTLLGDPLLVREGRKMHPTPRARALAVPLADSLRTLSQALAPSVAFEPSTVRGILRVGWMWTGLTVIPEFVQRMRNRAPGIDIHLLRVDRRANLQQPLAEGYVDLVVQPAGSKGDYGIRRGGRSDHLSESLYSQSLHPATWCCAVCKDHPTLRAAPTIDEYVSIPHILVSFGGDAYGYVDAALEKLGKKRRVAVLAQDFAEACVLASKTDYILTTDVAIAMRMREIVQLSLFPAPLDLPVAHLRQVWHQRTHDDPMHRWLREEMRQAGQDVKARIENAKL